MEVGPLSVEVVPFALTFREPYVTATGVLDRRESVLLRVRDENGITGLGEGDEVGLLGGLPLQITYQGGAGNDVILQAVPEPVSAVASLLGLGLWRAGGLLSRRWRRRGAAETLPPPAA